MTALPDLVVRKGFFVWLWQPLSRERRAAGAFFVESAGPEGALMFQRANLLLSASLFALTAAVAFPQTAAPAHKETLHWKFKPGEKLHYQLEAVEQRELRFRDG